MKLKFPEKINRIVCKLNGLSNKFNLRFKHTTNVILIMFGIFTFLYFTFVSISWKRFDIFNFLVSLTGILIIILSFKIEPIITLLKKWPKTLQYLLKVFFVCIILSFVIFMPLILFNMRNTSKAGADYVIVLGCQVAGEYASLPLLSRGYAAIRYLNKNPETNVVLTGGQGPGENITEAESLRRLLLENKIDKKRIFLEDKSKNTMENFIFSDKLYNLSDKNVIIVTSDYHIFRALSIARKLKYKNVYGLPSRSQRSILPAFLLREYVTVMYYKITGRI
ncbi:MAG: YdcF family protein [Treponema sp.]|jgi:uncharacterized SAM-binding protein YcdF (DUF218 family)|nr:YdcF family protein [Treponema sp.]